MRIGVLQFFSWPGRKGDLANVYGRGSDQIEHEVFEVAPDDSYTRFREHFELVITAWTNDRVTHHSDRWNFENVEVLPKPLQANPHSTHEDIRARDSHDSGLAGSNPVDRYLDDVVIWGSPGRVVDQLQQLEEEIGLEYLLASPLSQATFGHLTHEVLPLLL